MISYQILIDNFRPIRAVLTGCCYADVKRLRDADGSRKDVVCFCFFVLTENT